MISVNNITLQFGGRVLFENVNLKFTKGNCYGIIGANGAGKSTFLRILSGELEPNKGDVTVDKNERMSVLMQNQNAYDEYSVRDAVMWGHKRLMEVAEERNALYAKLDFSDEDGERAAMLEGEFADMNGYEAESAAETLLSGLKIDPSLFDTRMADLDAKLKVKVLLAQSLFGNPDILVLDEPTNNLDAKTVKWLEDYLMELDETTVIIVSHDMDEISENCTRAAVFSDGAVKYALPPRELFRKGEELKALGLDVPLTARLCALLKEKGVEIDCDFTAEDFVGKVLKAKGGAV